MMGGQGRCKLAMETGGRMLWDEDKKWSLRAEEDISVFLVVEIVALCVEGRACRNL
jgi:hypothetical protein